MDAKLGLTPHGVFALPMSVDCQIWVELVKAMLLIKYLIKRC